MILTITANPALDLTYELERLVPGESHRVPSPRVRAGGKGLNVARVAHSQGASVLALTTAGGNSGSSLVQDLALGGVPHEVVSIGGETRTSLAFVASDGEATLCNEVGHALTHAEQQALVDATHELSRAATVVAISGSMPPDAEGLLERLIAAASGRPVIADTSGPALIAAARAGATVLKPNREELASATSIADPEAGARFLLEQGATIVVVSLGEQGLLAAMKQSAGEGTSEGASEGASVRVYRARLPRVLRGNPTGAGDALVAAMATVIERSSIEAVQDQPEEFLREAVSWSAAAVLMPLAGEISLLQTELAAEVHIETCVAGSTDSGSTDSGSTVSGNTDV